MGRRGWWPVGVTGPLIRFSASTAVLALLNACGGGDGPGEAPARAAGLGSQVKQAQAAAPSPAQSAAVVLVSVDARVLFDWAEVVYPSLFPRGPQNYPLRYEEVDYSVRSYANGNHLGVTTTGAVFGLGPFTNQVLQAFGRDSDYAAQVQAAACQTYPGSCTVNVPLNECIDPAQARLSTGLSSSLVYDVSGAVPGTLTVDTTINGAAVFEGQNAIKTTTVTKGSTISAAFSGTFTLTLESFELMGSDGVTRSLGGLFGQVNEGFFNGVSTGISSQKSKTVFMPARDNLQFYLQLGQSRTTVSTSTVTFTDPATLEPLASTIGEPYTFEARETVTVLGKAYSSCRYRLAGSQVGDYTLSWYLLGKGVPVRIVSYLGSNAIRTQELRSGTYNGVPL